MSGLRATEDVRSGGFPRVLVVGTVAHDAAQGLRRRGSAVDTAPDLGAADLDAYDAVVLLAGSAGRPGLVDAVRTDALGLVVVGAVDDVASLGLESHAATAGSSAEPRESVAWPSVDLAARTQLDGAAWTTGYDLHDEGFALRGTIQDTVLGARRLGSGRIAVLGLDPEHVDTELLVNAVLHVARRTAGTPPSTDLACIDEWAALKHAVTLLQGLQVKDGSVPDVAHHESAHALVTQVCDLLPRFIAFFPHDAAYLTALVKDFESWREGGFAVPDFHDALIAFDPASQRANGVRHLVLFPMYTQNGSTDRLFEAVLIEVIWPEFVADLEAGDYANRLFLPIRFVDFTPGYDTHSAVLFPETVAMRTVPDFTWGGIFADREAARFRVVVSQAAQVTRLALPPEVEWMLDHQSLTEETFVMWDLIHDRTHMRGDLPFDPFMIKQRMPFFLYSLEELRCDLTAFRAAVALEAEGLPHARLVQHAILLDRIFRFAISGPRVRNYDGLGGQLLFAWLHQADVLHWTDNRLTIEWDRVAEHVLSLDDAITELYWRSIDRSKLAHWLAAYDLVSRTVEPHPASTWAQGKQALPLTGPLKEMTNLVLDDEFPLSMFYEALSKKMSTTIESTAGITS